MGTFQHPSVKTGRIHHGASGKAYAIENGLVDCPADVAAECGLVPAAADASKGKQKSEPKPEPKADAKKADESKKTDGEDPAADASKGKQK